MKPIVVMQHPADIGGVYSDEYLEHWGRFYLANPPLRRAGVLFATFLEAPGEILFALAHQAQCQAAARQPQLLPAQREVQRREDFRLPSPRIERAIAQLEREGASCANGRMVEKLKHHTFPRRPRRRVPVGV